MIFPLTLAVIGALFVAAHADLEQTYSYFHNEGFMEFGSTRIRKCSNPTYKRGHLQDCETLEYLFKMTSLKRKLTTSPKIQTKSSFKVESTNAPYSSYFENMVVNNMPFKGQMNSTASISMAECTQDASEYSMHPITKDYSIRKCIEKDALNKAITIPHVLYNSYTTRLPAPTSTNDDFVDISTQWPAIVELDGNKPRNIEHCPLSMHMVIWGTSDELSVRLFDMEKATATLNPKMGRPVLHYYSYDHNGFEEMNTSAYTDTSLMPGEYMFIPHTLLATFRASSANAFDKKPAFMRSCFFDGSNLNDVRSALTVEGLVNKNAERVAAALHRSDTFDFTMIREVPEQTTIAQYAVYPREAVVAAAASPEGEGSEENAEGGKGGGRRTRGKKDFRGWQENTRWNFLIASLTIPQPPAPSITAFGRTNASMHWITPYLPESQDKTKFGVNITVCLVDSVEKGQEAGLLSSRSAAQDKDVDGCQVLSVPREDLHEKVVEDLRSDIPQTTFSYVVKGLDTDTSYMFRAIIFYGEAGSHPSEWTEVVQTIAESVPAGIPSAVNASSSDKSSTHATLTFTKPFDDGGLMILGYHVHSRHVEKHHHGQWVWNGLYYGEESQGEVTIEVRNLVPGSMYEFRVSAFNELGNSTYETSNTVKTTAETGATTLSGAGHESRFNSKVFSDLLMKSFEDAGSLTFRRLTANQPVPGTGFSDDDDLAEVEINDLDQILSVRNKETAQVVKLEVWDSHWSPKLFKVSGNFAWTEPPLADSPIQSSLTSPKKSSNFGDSHMHGRIALVQRGKVPIVTKALHAQKAGAIACVILDDGRCNAFDQKCMPGASKVDGERFAVVDDPATWKTIKIPVVLVMEKDVSTLLDVAGLPTYERMQAIYDSRMSSEAEL